VLREEVLISPKHLSRYGSHGDIPDRRVPLVFFVGTRYSRSFSASTERSSSASSSVPSPYLRAVRGTVRWICSRASGRRRPIGAGESEWVEDEVDEVEPKAPCEMGARVLSRVDDVGIVSLEPAAVRAPACAGLGLKVS
jgi:hypothetical protein